LAEITQRFAGKHQAAPLPGRRCGRIRHRAPTPRHDLAARRRPGYFFNIIHARNAVDALRVFVDDIGKNRPNPPTTPGAVWYLDIRMSRRATAGDGGRGGREVSFPVRQLHAIAVEPRSDRW